MAHEAAKVVGVLGGVSWRSSIGVEELARLREGYSVPAKDCLRALERLMGVGMNYASIRRCSHKASL